MTAPLPPTAPLSVRVGARIGPEVVATVLAAVVILAGAAFFVLGPVSQPGVAARTPESSASPQPTATSSPLEATPETAAAKPVLEIVDRLLDEREALAAELGVRNPDVQSIADNLRAVNAGLVALDVPLASFEREGFTDLADRLREAIDATRDAVTNTLRVSITNPDAYVKGATNVVAVMDTFVAVRADLAALARTP